MNYLMYAIANGITAEMQHRWLDSRAHQSTENQYAKQGQAQSQAEYFQSGSQANPDSEQK